METGAVHCQKQMTAKVGQFRQHLAPLYMVKHAPERLTQSTRSNLLQNSMYLAVTGDDAHPVDTRRGGFPAHHSITSQRRAKTNS